MRLYAKGRILKRLGLDDVLMTTALLVAIAHAIVMTIAYHYGWGRHTQYLSDYQILNAVKWISVSQGMGVVAPALGRISFCLFMLQIVGLTSRWKRLSLHVTWMSQILINTVCVVMIYTQSGVHVSALWGAERAKCLDPSVQTIYGYFQSGFNSLSDLYLTILPAIVIWNLQTQTTLKAGLSALLCLSIFAFAASVVKTYEIHILNERGDITWNFVNFVIWAALEINIVIIVASVPTLSPLFKDHTSNRTYYMHTLHDCKRTGGAASAPMGRLHSTTVAAGSSNRKPSHTDDGERGRDTGVAVGYTRFGRFILMAALEFPGKDVM
ncbi:hypothetical protein LTR12_018351 [Friedmanniomyces endolithicus]|nr:hypothetical protein LTR12_018351 [Friedmanniomyces endolithicus]